MGPINVAVRRGDVVESRHRMHAVAVRAGDVIDAAGDPGLATFLRSAAKPFQALPLALEHPDLPSEEVAIACASHEARSEQLVAVRSLLRRARASEDDLECGPSGGSKLRHNCSGKHAGMLLRAESHGWSRSGYRLRDHPLQRDLAALVADAAGVAADEIETATDGCGVLTFAMPLLTMAGAFSRLVRRELPGAGRIVDAMRTHPDLVGGPKAPDSTLIARFRARSRSGARKGSCV